MIDRRLGRLALRVAVSGTRGKSSVTRLVAGALRESGRRVLAKTTGSAAVAILPDGSEQEIKRRGPASILEQEALFRLARRHRADALVSEMMSISPECLGVESERLLKPHLLLITNVRLDHREEQGRTREEVARSLTRSIRPGCTVLVPEADRFAVLEERAAAVRARLIRVPAALRLETAPDIALDPTEFEENIHLALAATDLLGLPRRVALRGMARAKPDCGHLRAVRADLGIPPSPWTLVSAFAANEPESTRRVLDKLREMFSMSGVSLRAILNLRDDRPDRTRQWLEALEGGFFKDFDCLALVGSGAVPALRRKLKSFGMKPGQPSGFVFSKNSPEEITRAVSVAPGRGAASGAGLIIGLGNMGGLGLRLKEYWERIGRPAEKRLD